MTKALCKISFLIWWHRLQERKKRRTFYLGFIGIAAFAYFLFAAAENSSIQATSLKSEVNMHAGIQIGCLALFLMLMMSNFACALASFYGAQDIPVLLALPVTRRSLLIGRGIFCGWNAAWSALIFSIPLFLGFLVSGSTGALGYLASATAFLFFLIIVTSLGILLATLFVNLIPMSRLVEFFAVFLTVFILMIASFSPDLGGDTSGSSLKDFGHELVMSPGSFVQMFPSVLLSNILSSSWRGAPDFSAVGLLIIWGGVFCLLTDAVFSLLFLRGWNLTFGLSRREKTMKKQQVSKAWFISQQVRALVAKERRMFLRDPSQLVQLLVILLLTFLYLFNLKSLSFLNFAGEEGAGWWQGVLGIANISMGGCVAAAIATRFVFPSVSLEGRAYTLLRATPLSISRLLLGKCLAWFLPVALITTILLLSGAFALQLPGLAIFHTIIVSLALAMGLVGLGVGMGAVHARFDWDHSSSLQSSLGSLLFMLFAFVLILATLLPSGLLFLTACVPTFAHYETLSQQGPILGSLILVVAINIVVARGAVRSGIERLEEMEKA